VSSSSLLSLETAYSDVMRIDVGSIPSADSTTLQSLASQVDGGTLTQSAAEAQIAQMAIGTTSVADLSYQFFTGANTYAAGLDYLVSPTGPNPNNLNSAYYQNFNLENRYINFAVNLGVQGEGAANFTAAYGQLSLSDALVKAYTAIFGTAPDAAKVDSLLYSNVDNGLGGTESRAQYFATYGGDGPDGQGTKAAMVGWLLAEAAKADLGPYAQANDAFLAQLAPGGVAKFHTDMLTAYDAHAASAAGVSITFNPDQSVSPTSTVTALQSTDGADTITGTGGVNVHQTIDSGNGDDVINIPGVVSGTVHAGDGNVTVTIGGLGSTPATLGVAAQYGSVSLGNGQDVVHLTGNTDAGTSITAGTGDNTLYLDGGANSASQGLSVHGFQTAVVTGLTADTGVTFDAPVTMYDEVQTASNYSLTLSAPDGSTFVLKNTSDGVIIQGQGEIHLDHFTGAATTQYGQSLSNFLPNGGSIVVADTNASPVHLHVDSDSTAGMIYAYDTVTSPGGSVREYATDLDISGAGSLTAQVDTHFTNVNASAAGDLNLTYAVNNGPGGVFTLSNGTDTLNLTFAGEQTGAAEKFVMGAGADTINVSGAIGNLGIAGQTVVTPPEIDGFKAGTDHLNLSGITAMDSVQAYATGAASLTDAMIAVSAHVQAGHGAVFEYGGDTYVYQQNAVVGVDAGDGLIKLVGVTGLSVASGSATGDIHFGS
jgi:hypothetical protein